MIVLLSLALTFTFFLPEVLPAATPPPPKQGCTDELVSFSPCLGYVSSPPNNVTDAADPQCCDAFWKSLEEGVSNCLCYLIQEPLIFGFPLNLSRVAALASACAPSSNATSDFNSSRVLSSFDLNCTGWQALPPLQGITGSVITEPYHFGPLNVTSPPLPNSPPPLPPPPRPEFGHAPPGSFGSPPAPTSLQTQARNSSDSGHNSSWNRWFLPAIIVSFMVFC